MPGRIGCSWAARAASIALKGSATRSRGSKEKAMREEQRIEPLVAAPVPLATIRARRRRRWTLGLVAVATGLFARGVVGRQEAGSKAPPTGNAVADPLEFGNFGEM